jgi:hypothetical protein
LSSPIRISHARRAGLTLLSVAAFLVAPAAVQASPVYLETVNPFVVLGGAGVTNTGPSVLNGDLGVSPGTSLPGFGLPAVVNGATHNNDAVAAQAQSDLTNAYNVAAGQPVAPGDILTGQNLGNRTLVAGAYRYASSAGLTGTLTLDAQGDPNAQFVFEIGSTLTTASASRVVLVNGASPCNVFWQVGSSATLGTTTAFQGNLMALSDISLNNGATVVGRMLARNGQITLINNVLTRPLCATPPGGSDGTSNPDGSDGADGTTGSPRALRRAARALRRRGVATISNRSRITPRTPESAPCTDGFRAAVRGRMIQRVVFRLDGRRVGTRTGASPFRISLHAAAGRHILTARVTFKDLTRAKTLRVRYRACASAVLQPRRGPSAYTG